MAHLFPHKDWWPDGPRSTVFTLRTVQWIVAIGTVLAALATGGSAGSVVIIAVGVIAFALLTGLRRILEMLVWQVEREEMAAKRNEINSTATAESD